VDNTWLLALQGMNGPSGSDDPGVRDYQMNYLRQHVPQAEWDAAVQKGWITQDGQPLNIPKSSVPQGQNGGQWESQNKKFLDTHLSDTYGWKPTDKTYHDDVYGDYKYWDKPNTLDETFWKIAPFLPAAFFGGGLALTAAAGGSLGAAGGAALGEGAVAGGAGTGALDAAGAYAAASGGSAATPFASAVGGSSLGLSNTQLFQLAKTAYGVANGNRNTGNILGSILGTVSGIPFGSTIGGTLGGMATPTGSSGSSSGINLGGNGGTGAGGNMADMNLGTLIAQALGGGASLYNAFGSGGTTDMGVAKDAAKLADPFAGERAGYQTQLRDSLTNPGSFTADPGYQFALSQGQDAIKGAGNAIYGGTRAGAIYPELAKFTEGYAAQNYDTRINQLLTAAGATSGSPGTAGALLARGGENRNNSIGTGLNSLLSGILGGAGSGNSGGILGSLLTAILRGSGGGNGAISNVPGGINLNPNPGDGTSYGDPGGDNINFNPNDGSGLGNLDDPYGDSAINWDAIFGGDGGSDFNFDWDSFVGNLG